jgi:hypothetical protein
MKCPECGADVPVGAKFCTSCGASMPEPEAAATESATPVAPVPPAVPSTEPPAVPQVVPPAYAPPATAAPAAYAPAPDATAPVKKKSRVGLIIGIVLGVLLLCFVCGGVGTLYYFGMLSNSGSTSTGSETTSGTPAAEPGTGAVDAEVEAAGSVVNDFYAAINATDMEKLKALVTEELRVGAEPSAFEGWESTTFEFTRGWIEGDSAFIVGRESIQQYGAGDNGGVKFTLVRNGDGWLVSGWQPVDTPQVEGQDTTGSSTGIPGPLSDATARDIVTQLLEARKIGAGNVVRRLATKGFLADNGDTWLDGIDNSETFTAFTITAVKVTGSTATVTVTETWPEGDMPTTYGLTVVGGNVLVDTWLPQ